MANENRGQLHELDGFVELYSCECFSIHVDKERGCCYVRFETNRIEVEMSLCEATHFAEAMAKVQDDLDRLHDQAKEHDGEEPKELH